MNIINKIKVGTINLIGISPFLNQTIIIGYNINIYIIFTLISSLILTIKASNRKLILNQTDLILISILDLYFILFSVNQDFYIFACYQFLILSFIFILFSKLEISNDYEFINYPISFIIILIIILIGIESSGIISNISFAARSATKGSVLGLALIFNFSGLMLFIKSRIDKKKYFFQISLLITFLSFIFFKTKGPIVAYLMCILFFNGLSFYKVISSFIFGLLTFYFSSLPIFRAGNTESTISRINTFLKSIDLLNNDFLTFNIIEKAPFQFHNWIFESLWRLNIFSLFYFAFIFFILYKYKNAYYYKWASIYILMCGLFSFPLETTLFSFTVFMILTIYESKINTKLIDKQYNLK